MHGPGAAESRGACGRSEPVGYRIKINPAEAAVVRRIFQDFREGNGEKALAKRLNAEKNGRLWRHNTVFLMLQNQKYIGQLHLQSQGVG